MWNDDTGLSIKIRKVIIYGMAFIVSLVLFLVSILFLLSQNNVLEIYISAIGVLLIIEGFIISIANKLVDAQIATKQLISLNINVVGNNVVITSGIENRGQNQIIPIVFYVIVDQLVLNNKSKFYEPSFLLKHEDKNECKLADLCLTGNDSKIKSCIKRDKGYCEVKRLDFLAPDSMLYINPSENFSEDVSLKLSQGVYRVLLIARFYEKKLIRNKKKIRCICANRNFVLE